MLYAVIILLLLAASALLIHFERRARREAPVEIVHTPDEAREDGCCGEHLVCERETLLQTSAKVEYYDDEELDSLAGMSPSDYTPAQHQAIREVFDTLRDKDVPGWCRSIQLRNIALPEDIREEALLIVRERRHLA